MVDRFGTVGPPYTFDNIQIVRMLGAKHGHVTRAVLRRRIDGTSFTIMLHRVYPTMLATASNGCSS